MSARHDCSARAPGKRPGQGGRRMQPYPRLFEACLFAPSSEGSRRGALRQLQPSNLHLGLPGLGGRGPRPGSGHSLVNNLAIDTTLIGRWESSTRKRRAVKSGLAMPSTPLRHLHHQCGARTKADEKLIESMVTPRSVRQRPLVLSAPPRHAQQLLLNTPGCLKQSDVSEDGRAQSCARVRWRQLPEVRCVRMGQACHALLWQSLLAC